MNALKILLGLAIISAVAWSASVLLDSDVEPAAPPVVTSEIRFSFKDTAETWINADAIEQSEIFFQVDGTQEYLTYVDWDPREQEEIRFSDLPTLENVGPDPKVYPGMNYPSPEGWSTGMGVRTFLLVRPDGTLDFFALIWFRHDMGTFSVVLLRARSHGDICFEMTGLVPAKGYHERYWEKCSVSFSFFKTLRMLPETHRLAERGPGSHWLGRFPEGARSLQETGDLQETGLQETQE